MGVRRGSQSLLKAFPTVAVTWHPDRNQGFTPDEVAGKSSIEAWWRCSAGHEWQERVSQRVSVIPKWKHGDPAACRECVPEDMLTDRAQVDHTFPCGHTVRTTMGTVRRHPERCWDCHRCDWEAQQTPERRAAKRKAYREKVATLGPRPTLTAEQRSAQRRVLGMIRRSGVVDAHALTLWRPWVAVPSHWGLAADGEEVAALLAVLAVPHMVTETPVMVSPFSKARARHLRVHVFREDWQRLVELFPSLASVLEDVPPEEEEARIGLRMGPDSALSFWYAGGEIVGQWPASRDSA